MTPGLRGNELTEEASAFSLPRTVTCRQERGSAVESGNGGDAVITYISWTVAASMLQIPVVLHFLMLLD